MISLCINHISFVRVLVILMIFPIHEIAVFLVIAHASGFGIKGDPETTALPVIGSQKQLFRLIVIFMDDRRDTVQFSRGEMAIPCFIAVSAETVASANRL